MKTLRTIRKHLTRSKAVLVTLMVTQVVTLLPVLLPVLLSALLGSLAATSVRAQVSISIPGLSIGINLPQLPNLVQVPGYPVYYAPQVRSNYFFYDGMYWVFGNDQWYSSVWYNGPWSEVGPQSVPVFILRVPEKYYRSPPRFFRGGRASAAPPWDDHWGVDWSRQRPGWDQWDRRLKPRPAPIPSYQRQYPAPRYPRVEQQMPLHERNYLKDPDKHQNKNKNKNKNKDENRDKNKQSNRGNFSEKD